MIDLVYRIGLRVQAIADYQVQDRDPRLRKQNRIRSIHSSCSIEANSLTLDQVTDIINGRRVIGPEREIREIKNANSVYSMLGRFDPYDIDDLLEVHAVLTEGLVEGSGKFRKGGEGVFAGDELIFMAPPPESVPDHMEGLFRWIKENKGATNPLISSSVFHYEFVFIHPFSDGNGRIARLWQTAMLGDWNELFYWIPIENRIEKAQDQYYDVINRCNSLGESTPFVEFMLSSILSSLEDAEYEIRETSQRIPESVKQLTEVMETGGLYSTRDLQELMGMSSRPSFNSQYMRPAFDYGLMEMEYPESPRRPGQRYRLKG